MKKNITIAAAEAIAANGWEITELERDDKTIRMVYHHPEKEGRITFYSSRFDFDQMISYVCVPGMNDGYFDLVSGEFVEC